MDLDADRQLELRFADPRAIADAAAPARRATRSAEAELTTQGDRGAARPGRRPDSYYRLAVGAAVLHLGDRAALECNILAQLNAVRRLADERYPGKIWRRGLCLRELIQEAIDETIEDADGEDLDRIRLVLARAASGATLSEIARELGIRRESLSRRLWSRITALIWERLKPRLLTLES